MFSTGLVDIMRIASATKLTIVSDGANLYLNSEDIIRIILKEKPCKRNLQGGGNKELSRWR